MCIRDRENIRQRQAEGIAVAKLKGVAFGRPRKEIPEEFPDVARLWENNQISIDVYKRQISRMAIPGIGSATT